ncbi:hypothetical protein MHYP_G00117540 [Metynnis hypsauchen]
MKQIASAARSTVCQLRVSADLFEFMSLRGKAERSFCSCTSGPRVRLTDRNRRRVLAASTLKASRRGGKSANLSFLFPFAFYCLGKAGSRMVHGRTCSSVLDTLKNKRLLNGS